MKASRFFVATLKEAPADAEIVSHRLMLRAGLIKRLSAGIYSYMPMGLRVIRKVEAIIREEMNAAGAVELLMPVVQPAELWQESGRFQSSAGCTTGINRALAGVGALPGLWSRTTESQGSPRTRLRDPAHQ